MWRRLYSLVLLQLLILSGESLAFSGGSGSAACLTLTPSHQQNVPQTSEVPATIVFDTAVSLNRNQLKNITIQANPGTTFRGFTIQARRLDITDPEQSSKDERTSIK